MEKKKIEILIKKCNSKDYWYFNKVGHKFIATEDSESMYWVDNHKLIGDDSETGGVFKCDAEVLSR
ncbi:hypothetical protein [Paenibacillus oleatilyticus]|uniref:hypothetical protein n=1 Tax=Paenibacillus oleatilyticus TaxID=2594886 RepID=UPI001C1F368E|nr:hypothetical protein [Paenibacillus oleatilyticus]MBU7316070.1 hypothetical protein [Paenibacillus oleatilyticus]